MIELCDIITNVVVAEQEVPTFRVGVVHLKRKSFVKCHKSV